MEPDCEQREYPWELALHTVSYGSVESKEHNNLTYSCISLHARTLAPQLSSSHSIDRFRVRLGIEQHSVRRQGVSVK